MGRTDRFHCIAVIIITWDDSATNISIRFGLYYEYCCMTWVGADLRQRGCDTLCVPWSDIDVGGRLDGEHRRE